MAQNIFVETGASSYAQPGERISSDLFGARYTAYEDLDRFLAQINDLDLGIIVWPGGTLAETRSDLFDLGADGLWTGRDDRPDLTEMMAVASEAGVTLSVILPTVRYLGAPDAFADDVRAFAEDLLSGAYGKLPPAMTLEIGSEYFAHFKGADAAADYGALADVAVRELTLALSDPAVNASGADVTIAVQAGKTFEDDEAIRAALSQTSLEEIDSVIHHRFAYQPQGIDARIPELERILDAWEEARGGDMPDLFVSAWNTVTLVRSEVVWDYIDREAEAGRIVDPTDIDLGARSHQGFESYWQDKLASASYGQEHAAFVLETFASYAEAGMDAGAAFGVDWVHPGRMSWREDGTDYDFVAKEMLEMIHESVGGTFVHESGGAYDRDDAMTPYVFENEDKVIVFLAAGRTGAGDVALSIEGLGDELRSVRADRLVSETPEDWMAIFGIPDTPGVDESPEGETFALGAQEDAKVAQDGDVLTLSLDAPHDIVRLSFAKTEAGAREIAGYSDAPLVRLRDPDEVVPVAEDGPEEAGGVLGDTEQSDDIPDEMQMMADAASSGGLGALLLLGLLLLL